MRDDDLVFSVSAWQWSGPMWSTIQKNSDSIFFKVYILPLLLKLMLLIGRPKLAKRVFSALRDITSSRCPELCVFCRRLRRRDGGQNKQQALFVTSHRANSGSVAQLRQHLTSEIGVDPPSTASSRRFLAREIGEINSFKEQTNLARFSLDCYFFPHA